MNKKYFLCLTRFKMYVIIYKKELLKMIDEGILPMNWESKDMATIAKNLPKRIFADCIKEEPEMIDLIGGDKFGKLCNHIVMTTARKFLENSFIKA